MELEPISAAARELLRMQRAEEAEAILRNALRSFPENEDLRTHLAHALLMQGRLLDGFREYESRRPRQMLLSRRMDLPEWSGPIAGRSILLWAEQGIGDEIQTARFVRNIREAGAHRVYVACRKLNERIFQQLGADAVFDRGSPQMLLPRDTDCWVKMWSLPYRLGLTLADISGAPYLSAEPAARGGIGLVERGNPNNPHDANRSLPAGLLQRAVPQGRIIEPVGDAYDSLRQIAGLDLLITVDTSWAHMAGALGVPCWVLLPFCDLDWRWMRERRDSPWYDSLRLFRQPSPGDWGVVVDAVAAELAEFAVRAP